MKKSLGAKTILYPTLVLIVGTHDKAGKPHFMTVAWGASPSKHGQPWHVSCLTTVSPVLRSPDRSKRCESIL